MKTPNASEKVLGTRKGNVSGAKRVAKVRDGEFSEMISNLMEPHHPFLLPRTVPTSAGVIFHKPQLPIINNLSDEPSGVLIIRPNVQHTITMTELVDTQEVLASPIRTPNSERVFFPGGTLSLASPILLADKSEVRGSIQDLVTYHFEQDGTLRQGAYEYPNLSWTTAAGIRVTIVSDSLVAGQVVRFTLAVDQVTRYTIDVTAGEGKLNFLFELDGAITQGRIRMTSRPNDLPPGLYYSSIQFAGFERPRGYVYRTVSLWDMLGSLPGASTSRIQYSNAERYSITGFSALIQNTTASQYKSGSVVAAQLPGGSSHLLPSEPDEAYRFISSYNDPKTYSGQLNKGVHWFFTPEKVQDWFFRDVRDPEGERPYLALAWSGVATNDLANMLGLVVDIRINIELLTTDISLMKFMPTADLSRLMDIYVTLVSAHSTVGENPDHRIRINKIVKDILKNPYVKNGLELMREAGKIVLPLALAAL